MAGNMELIFKLAANASNFISNFKAASNSMAQVSSQTQNLKDRFQQVQTSSSSIFKGTALSIAALTGVVAGYTTTVISFTNKVVNAAANARKGARLGFGVEQYQELSYAAKMSGVAVEGFENSVKKMVINLAKANKEGKKGKGGLSGDLNQLGLNAATLSRIAPDQALAKVARAFTTIKDPALRARLAVGLFGKEGMAMIPMLQKGAVGIQAFRDEARKMGIVLSKETVEKAKTYGLMQKRFSAVFEGLKLTIGTALLPVVMQGMEQLTNFVISHQKDIQAFGTQFSNSLISSLPYIKSFFISLYQVVSTVYNLSTGLINLVGGLDKLVYIAGIFIALKIGLAFYDFGRNLVIAGIEAVKMVGIIWQIVTATRAWVVIQTILDAVLSANPIALFIIAAAGLIAIGITIYANWTKIKDLFATLWIGAIDAISQFYNYTVNKLGALFEWIAQKWQAIKGMFSSNQGISGTPAYLHQAGGIFSSPHIGIVAENGPEAIIPLNSKGIGLWKQAGSILGASSNIVINFSPTIYGSNVEQNREMLKKEKDSLLDLLKNQQRLSFR